MLVSLKTLPGKRAAFGFFSTKIDLDDFWNHFLEEFQPSKPQGKKIGKEEKFLSAFFQGLKKGNFHKLMKFSASISRTSGISFCILA